MNECIALLIPKRRYRDTKSWEYDRQKVVSLKRRGFPFVCARGHTYVYPKTIPQDEFQRLRGAR
jgi:hypothetical protein